MRLQQVGEVLNESWNEPILCNECGGMLMITNDHVMVSLVSYDVVCLEDSCQMISSTSVDIWNDDNEENYYC